MRRCSSGFFTVVHVLICMAILAGLPRAAMAQAVGAGPLTATLAVTEPTSGVFDWGIVKLAPGLVISELGHDSNIFDEAVDPKDDWVFRGTPDVSAFSAVRFAKLSMYAGSQLAYFNTYSDENSAGYEYRGRLDMLLSRFLPYVGAGETKSRERPNGEIDTRAEQRQKELSGGVAFSLGPHSQVYTGVSRYRQEYFNAVEEGVDLSESLNHDSFSYSAGVQTALTPLTTITVFGGLEEDRFESSPLRNTDRYTVNASTLIGAEAVISGTINVGFLEFKPADPAVEPYRGMTLEAGITYPFLEIGRLSVSVNRGIEYSFDEAEAYYEETTGTLSYTHRLFGDIDFQVRGSQSKFDYGFRDGVEARTDKLSTVGASFGYNLRNRTRISVNYEFAQRRSPAFEERNYDRTRIYLSWAYAF